MARLKLRELLMPEVVSQVDLEGSEKKAVRVNKVRWSCCTSGCCASSVFLSAPCEQGGERGPAAAAVRMCAVHLGARAHVCLQFAGCAFLGLRLCTAPEVRAATLLPHSLPLRLQTKPCAAPLCPADQELGGQRLAVPLRPL